MSTITSHPDTAVAPARTTLRAHWFVVAVLVAILAVTVTFMVTRGGDGAVRPGTLEVTEVVEPQPATFHDLRTAAGWAAVLEQQRPDLFPPEGHRATHDDLIRAATHATR